MHTQGYKQKRAFIIAQGPMHSTVRNLWKMIYDRKSAVVVMVSGLVEGGQESSTQYWPSSGVYQYGEYIVDLLGEEPLEGFTIRNLSVMDTKVCQYLQSGTFYLRTAFTDSAGTQGDSIPYHLLGA